MIKLTEFKEEHYQLLVNWLNTPKILMQVAGYSFTFPLTVAQIKNSVEDKNRYCFLIENELDEGIGHAEIYIKPTGALLGKIIIGDDAYRGKGLGKQVVNKLLDIAFNILGQPMAELNVFDWNTGAIKCYEKCGFILNPYKQLQRQIEGETWTAVNMFFVSRRQNTVNYFPANTAFLFSRKADVPSFISSVTKHSLKYCSSAS